MAVVIVWQVMMGVGLAACAGLRAFLPLLVVGLAGRLELVPLGSRFEWMAGDPALIVLGVAVVLELAADKVPVLDNVLDLAGTFVRPAAGAIAAASPLAALDPLTAMVVGVILGTTVAGTVHFAKTGLRLGSTGATGGLANPALSVAEDGLTLGGSLMSLFAPVMMFALVIGLVWLVVRAIRSRPRGSRQAS
jgi:hypothetical protein